jgi:RecG-like helicase
VQIDTELFRQLSMQTNNFQPLKGRWQELYLFAISAERYVHEDPLSAVIKLRSFSESLVGWIYRKLQLPTEPNDTLYEKVNADVFVEIIDESIRQKIHAIRLLGNKAAHAKSSNVIKSNEALLLIKEAYLLGQWLYKTYTDNSNNDYPEYSAPEAPVGQVETLNQSNKKLSNLLNDAKNELEKLKEDEKLYQQKINDLNRSLDEAELEKFRNASSEAADSIELESENVNNIISIDDAFVEYSLSEDQQELITRLDTFLSGQDENIFILRGYAGTGKTFITKGLTEYFKAIGRNYLLAAPTGKAAKVVANRTRSQANTIHKSIYSSKAFKERLVDN